MESASPAYCRDQIIALFYDSEVFNERLHHFLREYINGVCNNIIHTD